MIFMPPRHGKSELISYYFLTWLFGYFPDTHVILATHSARFSRKWGRRVRNLLKKVGNTVFPEPINISQDSQAADIWVLNNYLANIRFKQQLLKDADDVVKDIIKNYAIEISEKFADEIETKILNKLDNDKEPSAKLLANYLNLNGLFYLEYETRKRYMKTEKGFKEISVEDVSDFFNKHFGYNEISENKSKSVLGFITRKIERNYDLIQFENGTLNTADVF